MATQEHLELSSFIKGIHSSLRTKSKKIGYDKAWEEHIEDQNNLEKYASSMKELATKHWDDNSKNNTKAISRINWAYTFIVEYFFHGKELQKHRQKEREILDKLGISYEQSNTCFSKGKLALLDVGSCYNPFEIYKCFNLVPIDIAPATDNVFKCDFINVDINDGNIYCAGEVTHLERESFPIIVFSLFLEYLPSPDQRLKCCEKAYNLLTNEGILIIITPDSKHVGANAKYMKSWRYVLSQIGFSRIKYEKLPYLHCMVFRKSIHIEVPRRWARLNADQDIFHALHIPQDFQDEVELKNSDNNDCYSECNFLGELPFNNTE